MRPSLQLLDDALIGQIIDEAIIILSQAGIKIENQSLLNILGQHGAASDPVSGTVYFTRDLIDRALSTTPRSFRLYDRPGNPTHHFADRKVHFTPGSSALYILDPETVRTRRPATTDYINYAKIVQQLDALAAQSTAFIPADIHDRVADSYRLFLSLLFSDKPVVTGAFTIESFEAMKEMQVIIRGSEAALKAKPLTIFSCCPTSPLKWSHTTSQNLVDCAVASIPVEIIAMPLAGFIAPVTLTGTLIQHTAETLSGIVIAQLINPGTPVLYGGSPAVFDVRYQTTPMGAIETMMIDCAYNEIGKKLNIPTQAYIGLSDAKTVDAQAGLESGMGAVMAGLSGINSISGPGMMDFENCFSLSKLVIDHEICRMVFRLIDGITPKEDFPALPLIRELLEAQQLFASEHTVKHLRTEHHFPDKIITRSNRAKWETEGCQPTSKIADSKVISLLNTYNDTLPSVDIRKALFELMEKEAHRHQQSGLPISLATLEKFI
jgi:trimethylamine--corrinoid protein Co-methyltransferase